MAKILNLSGLAASLTRLRDAAYQRPPESIRGVNPSNWPSALQPVAPIGQPNAKPLAWPFWTGQNLNFTPRPDEELAAPDLRSLAKYPLARICIENTKDQLCKLPLRIQLRQQPGETLDSVNRRRILQQKGDAKLLELSRFWEVPDGDHEWPNWLRPIVDDMLVVDAASILIEQTLDKKITSLCRVPGDNICCYIDDFGRTPKPPSPAYSQLWEGTPRVNLTTDQLLYRPRNLVTRNTISSYLYGMSPVEQVADEIRIGMARLEFVWNYYKTGSLPNAIQVVPPNVDKDKMKEAMDWINSELSGNLDTRRQFRLIQGFNRDGKGDQIIFPKEPVLADVFDDLHIRKISFALFTAPQRLMRMMNRASAQISQEANEEEGIRPLKDWLEKCILNPIIWRQTGTRDYEAVLVMERSSDDVKRNKMQINDVHEGLRTVNQVLLDRGEELSSDPAADQLAVTTTTGRVPIGQPVETTKPVVRGDPTPVPIKKLDREVPCLTQ